MCEGVREFFNKFFTSSELNIESENSDDFGEHSIDNDSEINSLRSQVLFRDRLIEHLHDTIKAQSRAIDLLTQRTESRNSCSNSDSYETWRDQQGKRLGRFNIRSILSNSNLEYPYIYTKYNSKSLISN